MNELGYWASTHEEVTEEELQERLDSTLDAGESPVVILGQEFDRSHIYRELDTIGYNMYVDQEHDRLMQEGSIIDADELQDEQYSYAVSWADDTVLPLLTDELQDNVDNDSEQYHWAIGELMSIGILEYTDYATIEIHAHYDLDYIVNYIAEKIIE